MASEDDARVGAIYDHERDERPLRRRRAAADWGVNEDIFDRMPSRRFKRADRRAEHRDEAEGHRFERRASGPARRDDWTDEQERRQVAPRPDDWHDAAPRPASGRDDAPRAGERDAPPRRAAKRDAAPRRAGEWDDAPRAGERDAAPRRAAEPGDAPRAAATVASSRRVRRPAESWTDDIPAIRLEGDRPVDSWLEPARGRELALAPGESRTIVLADSAPLAGAIEAVAVPVAAAEAGERAVAPGRRTVTITGHPDRLPAPRAQRPARTAVERLGHRPDQIVGYAVALGFLLVLIAVLTTG